MREARRGGEGWSLWSGALLGLRVELSGLDQFCLSSEDAGPCISTVLENLVSISVERD